MSLNAASDNARSASRGTTSTSSPKTRSTRTLSVAIFRYGVSSLPSGNSGVCLYGGVGWVLTGAFMSNSWGNSKLVIYAFCHAVLVTLMGS